MDELNAVAAPVVAPVVPAARPRAPLEFNLVCLGLAGVITLSELACLYLGMDAKMVVAVGGGTVTALFALVSRGAAA